jgi:hypothetical protein
LFILITIIKARRNNMSCNVVQHTLLQLQSEASLKFPQKCRRYFSHLRKWGSSLDMRHHHISLTN